MERATAIFAAVNFLVIGLSHLLQGRAWREFFAKLLSLGQPGAFVNGMLALAMGTVIVSFHNVWSGVPLVLTLVGWLMVSKALVVLVLPEWGLESMRAPSKIQRPSSWSLVCC